ncbi:MAG: LysR family transcriptional regulator [Tyzzerella sp.]|nr:LysR family transcriptional regulator [Tyzzerella sp.]
MDLRSLEIFIQVAELNSFTKAGEKLGYSQPTVSFQIKQLEQELGVQLFDRIGHTVSLTDAGKDALAYAQKMCHMSQEMILGASRRYEVSGNVHIGMADSLCSPLIAREFAKFRETYPNVSLKVTPAGTDELYRLLDHNEVDLVCTLDDHIYNMTYVMVSEEKVGAHIIVSSKNPLALKSKVTIDDLLSQSFILTEKGMSYRRMLDEHLAKYSVEIHPVLEMSSADLICRLVEKDVGISFLPDYVTENAIKEKKAVRLEIEDFDVELWKQIFHHRDKWVSSQMEAFIKHLSGISLQD